MQRKKSKIHFGEIKGLFGKIMMATVLLAALIIPAFSQDDEALPARVLDARDRQIGKAEIIPDSGVTVNFSYYIKMWLDDGRLRIIRPSSGSRASTIKCWFREYKVDSSDPKDKSRWEETASGTASLQMPPTGEVQSISVSMIVTKKVIGDNDVEVNEKPERFSILFE